MLESTVCIIGGGISGNFLACQLRLRSIPCIVIEKHASFTNRPLQCAGILSQKILKLAPFPSKLILNRVTNAEIISPNGISLIMKGDENPVIIDRIGFDAYYGHRAQQLGAQYLFDARYISHKRTPQGDLLVFTSKDTIRCELVVGADGPGSSVAKQFNHTISYISAAQVRIKYPYPGHQTQMKFDSRWNALFGYIVPEGINGICRVGIATKNYPGAALDAYLNEIGASREKIVSKQGGLIPFGYPRFFIFDRTLLLGDAAQMVKATTGGGIVMAISAAKLLGQAIQKAIRKQNFSQRFFIKHYYWPVYFHIGLQLRLHYIIRLFLEQLSARDFDRFINIYKSSKLSSIFIEYADMDFPLKLVLRLLFNKAFIAYLGHLLVRYYPIFFKIPRILLF